MSRLRYIALLLLLIHNVAEAHLLKVFAYVEGSTVHGSVYFAGGANAVGARVTISGKQHDLSATLKTDQQGTFRYGPVKPGDYHIRADTGDGHQAEWLIQSAEFSGDLPTLTPKPSTAGAIPQPFDANPATNERDPQLTALIEQAVARQIGPLRTELHRYADRVRLSDILGGIGFIFGLAGIALWWHAKNGGRHQ